MYQAETCDALQASSFTNSLLLGGFFTGRALQATASLRCPETRPEPGSCREKSLLDVCAR
eukprot:m.28680 g.28680  ORF g.28680 m.28680 type:complete len:60 (-) comp4996_c0_seq2:1272-1451(-)